MQGLSAQDKERLCQCLADVFSARSVSIDAMSILSGGAIQENWALDLTITGGQRDGHLSTVLRTDSPTGVAVSLSRAREFSLLQAAWDAGVTVPEPLLCVTDMAVIGKEFCLMRRVGGTALGQRITRDMTVGGDRE
ncbi:MAG TPA: phosphotransferase family protein, partial [Rhodospirillaceae bacterium]|nr:phosphotransferase family protein [Rhodospirillaceae bacterium]